MSDDDDADGVQLGHVGTLARANRSLRPGGTSRPVLDALERKPPLGHGYGGASCRRDRPPSRRESRVTEPRLDARAPRRARGGGYGDVRTYAERKRRASRRGARRPGRDRVADVVGSVSVSTSVSCSAPGSELANVVDRDPLASMRRRAEALPGHLPRRGARPRGGSGSSRRRRPAVRSSSTSGVRSTVAPVRAWATRSWRASCRARSPGVTATSRNWTTVTALLTLADEG